MPKVISVGVREIVLQVREYFLQEKQFAAPIIPFEKVHERVAAATGISLHSISNIVKEGKLGKIITPSKKKRKKEKVAVDNFVDGILRKKIYEYFMMKKSKSTQRKLLQMLIEEIDFKSSQEILQQHIKKIGYGFRKSKGKVYFVPNEILALGGNDDQAEQNEDTESYPIDYLDETFEDSSLISDRCIQDPCSDGETEGVVNPTTISQNNIPVSKEKEKEGVHKKPPDTTSVLLKNTLNVVNAMRPQSRVFILKKVKVQSTVKLKQSQVWSDKSDFDCNTYENETFSNTVYMQTEHDYI